MGIINLMEELQEQILGYCHMNDLKNLSLTNTHHYLTMRKHLNTTLNIPEHSIRTDTCAEQLLSCEVKTLRLNSRSNIPENIYKAVSMILCLQHLDLRNVK